MKLAATLIALSVLAIPATTQADEPAACSPGYELVQSVGGPLCVNPIYLDGQWQDDPATCEHGYYQGSCAPAPLPPEEPFAPEAYTYQQIPVTVPVVVPIERFVADDRLCLIQRPC